MTTFNLRTQPAANANTKGTGAGTTADPFIPTHTVEGVVDVAMQDQTTPAVVVKLNAIQNSTTLAAGTSIDDMSITVADATGFSAGRYVIIFSNTTGRFYIGTIISVVSTTINLDTPLDSVFPIGANVDVAITNMDVDGSVTRQIFGIRGAGAGTPVSASVDITRLIFKCTTTNSVVLNKFGDLTRLTKGVVMRKVDGTTQNICNFKDNGELAGLVFDFDTYSVVNPQQGVNGFVARLTFAGQEKIGVSIRLAPTEDLQVIIQDDLSSLLLFEIVAEGHIVED